MFRTQRTYVALTDADGCIFNPIYLYLLLHVIAQHHQFIYQYGYDSDNYRLNKDFVDNKLIEIIAEIENLTSYTEGGQVSVQNTEPYRKLVAIVIKSFGYGDLEQLEKDENIDINDILVSTGHSYRNYISNLGELGEKLLNTLVFAANKPFLSEIQSRIELDQYDHFVLLCGSNRQSKALDDVNNEDNCTGSFFVTLAALREKFNELLKTGKSGVECSLDMFLMADIYGGHQPGTSFQLILEELRDEMFLDLHGLEHSEYVFDKSKFSLMYAMLHHIASQRQDEQITLAFWEDTEEIYFSLMKAFNDHCDLIPKNIDLEFWPYEGNLPWCKNIKADNISEIKQGKIFTLKGTGDIDFNYVKNVLKMPALSGYDEDEKPAINAAADMDINKFKVERDLGKVNQVANVDDLSRMFESSLTFFGGNQVTEEVNQNVLEPGAQSNESSERVVPTIVHF